MRASQELRWKQSIKENEERRRRYTEASRRIEDEQRTKAQEVLERRRLERARMDELMRNPAQQPAPPTKCILRKGAGAVLRTQAAAKTASSNVISKQPTGAAAVPPDRARPELEGQRREWSEGLKQYIARQREALKAAGDGQGDDHADALSWQELKMAAEAGFEELLRHQEAAAAGAANFRCPGMSRPRGGGAVLKHAVTSLAAGTADSAVAGIPSSRSAAPQPPIAAPPGPSHSNSASPTSKWALRMKQMLDDALETSGAGVACAPPTAAACMAELHCNAEVSNVPAAANNQGGLQGQQGLIHEDQGEQGKQAEQQLGLSFTEQEGVAANETPAAAEVATCRKWSNEALVTEHLECIDTPDVHSGGISPCTGSSPHHGGVASQSDCRQQLSVSAQIATAALRDSMEKLHRATDIMLSAVRCSQSASMARASAAAASHSGPPAQDDSSETMGLNSPALHRLQQLQAHRPCQAAVDVQYGVGGCLLETMSAAATGNKATDIVNSSNSPGARLAVANAVSGVPDPLHTTHSIGAIAAEGACLVAGENLCVQSEVSKQAQGPCQDNDHTAERQHDKEHSLRQQEVEQHDMMQQVEQALIDSAGQMRCLPCVAQEARQPLQPNVTAATSPGLIRHDLAASGSSGDVALACQQAKGTQHQMVAAIDTFPDMQSTLCVPAAAGQQHDTAENAAAGPTLDSLLTEVQQLAALRKALKAEFVAMGHGSIAAAIGTLGLSKDKGMPATQLQPPIKPQGQAAKQQQQGQCTPDQSVQQEVPQSVEEQNASASEGHLAGLPGGQQVESATSYCCVKHKAAGLQAVRVSAEALVKQLVTHLPSSNLAVVAEYPNRLSLSAADITASADVSYSSLRQQSLQQQGQACRQVTVRQQQLMQNHQAPPDSTWQLSQHTEQHHQQQSRQSGVEATSPLAATQSAAPQDSLQPVLSAGNQGVEHIASAYTAPASASLAPPQIASTPELAISLAGAAMDLSFSFGLAAVQQQQDLSSPASPQLMQDMHGTDQLGCSHVAADTAACMLQVHQQPDPASWHQHQLQNSAVQLSADPARGLTQSVQQQRQQQQMMICQGQASAQQAALPPVSPLLRWSIPAQVNAATGTSAEAASLPLAPVRTLPAVLDSAMPQLPCISKQPGFHGPVIPAAMHTPAAAANANGSSSLFSSTMQRPAAVSSWITASSTSTRQESPLPLPGRIGVLAAAAARKPAGSSPDSAAAGGSVFLEKLSKQSSPSGRNPAKSGAAAAATSKPTSAGGRANGLAAAERQLANQGSYLAAALQAKQRMETEQGERQRLEAAAAAAKQAASRKLQEDLQLEHRLAAVQSAQQIAPVAIGRCAQGCSTEQQPQQQPQQCCKSPAKHAGQLSHGSTTPRNPGGTQPIAPAVQNSSPSPPRRVMCTASGKKALAAAPSEHRAANHRNVVSKPSSGLSTPSPPASRIPSAPGSPRAKTAYPAGLVQQQPTNVMQYSGCITGLNDAEEPAESLDSDFDHLERELTDANNTQAVHLGRPASRVQPVRFQQAAAEAIRIAPTPCMLMKKAIENETVEAGNQAEMWVAVQAAAAAAMHCNASQHESGLQQHSQASAAGLHKLDSRATVSRPSILCIPASDTSSVAPSPAAVTTARSATQGALGKVRATGSAPPLPARQVPRQSAVGQQQQQQHVTSRARGAMPPKASATHRGKPHSPAGHAVSKVPAAAVPPTTDALLEAHRLSLEEAELLASLQQLDDMQARAKQQIGSNTSTTTAAPGQQVGPAAINPRFKLAARQGVRQACSASSTAFPGHNVPGAPPASNLYGTSVLSSAGTNASRGGIPRSHGQLTSGAATAGNKIAAPSPGRAKEQRQTKLAAARAPAAVGPGARVPKDPAVITTAGAGAIASRPMHAAGLTPSGAWFGPWQASGGMPGQQYPHLQMTGYIPTGFGHPGMAWGNIEPTRQQQHGLGPHAAAALAAAVPAHFQQPGQLGMYGPATRAAMCGMQLAHLGQGSAPCGVTPAQQQQQMYWAAMQAQQYHQWRHLQPMGMMYPGTAGDMMGYSRPWSGATSQMQPPQSAPGGSQYLPGSPLLPTLQYQQTVMRNRTSAGDSDESGSRRSSDTVSGLPQESRGHASAWQQQQQPGSADVWPSRGVDRVQGKGSVAAGSSRQGERGDNGTVHVYKPSLLL